MKKSFMRKVCLVLSLLMVFTLVFAGCSQKTSNQPAAPSDSGQPSQGAAPAEGQAPAPPSASYKIGLNNLRKGAYALDVLENTAKFATLTLGSEFFSVNDEGKIEKVVQDVQSLIAAGCDGIEIFCVVETLFPVVAKACEEARVPFVFYDKVPASEETRAALMKNPYFVGAVGSQNYQAGQAIGKAAVEAGCKKAIIVAAQQ